MEEGREGGIEWREERERGRKGGIEWSEGERGREGRIEWKERMEGERERGREGWREAEERKTYKLLHKIVGSDESCHWTFLGLHVCPPWWPW